MSHASGKVVQNQLFAMVQMSRQEKTNGCMNFKCIK
jgi:hypothetical protein